MNSKIKDLENENLRLQKEANFYKDTLECIPKFIIKLFSKKSLKLDQGEGKHE